MVREWWWWRAYQPSWEVSTGGRIIVTPTPEGEYEIKAIVPITYTSRESRHKNFITHPYQSQVLEIRHHGTRRERNPYPLKGSAKPDQIHLLPGETEKAIYEFGWITDAKPLLGKTAKCRLKIGAHVTLEGIRTDRFLKSRNWFQLEVSDK